MSDIQRYKIAYDKIPRCEFMGMYPSDCGDKSVLLADKEYVKYDDHITEVEKLQADKASLYKQLEEARKARNRARVEFEQPLLARIDELQAELKDVWDVNDKLESDLIEAKARIDELELITNYKFHEEPVQRLKNKITADGIEEMLDKLEIYPLGHRDCIENDKVLNVLLCDVVEYADRLREGNDV